MLARAFQNDVLMQFLFPDEQERKAKSHLFYEFIIRYGVMCGEVYAVSPMMEGVSVWLDSKYGEFPQHSMEKAGIDGLIARVGLEVAEKISTFTGFLRFKREHILPFRHCYFWILGVEPEFQGQGLASRIIRPKLKELDRNGLHCYLETQSRKNASLYEHYGFVITETFPLEGFDQVLYCMVRESAVSTSELKLGA